MIVWRAIQDSTHGGGTREFEAAGGVTEYIERIAGGVARGNTSIGKSPETRRNVVKALRRFGKATCLDGGSMLAREMLQAFEQDDCLPRDTLKIVWAMDKDERQLVQNK